MPSPENVRRDWFSAAAAALPASAASAALLFLLYRRNNRNREDNIRSASLTADGALKAPKSVPLAAARAVHSLLYLPVDLLRVATEYTRPWVRGVVRLSANAGVPCAVNAHYVFRQVRVLGEVAVDIVEYRAGCRGTVPCTKRSSSTSTISTGNTGTAAAGGSVGNTTDATGSGNVAYEAHTETGGHEVEHVVVYLHGGGFSLDDHRYIYAGQVFYVTCDERFVMFVK